MVVIVNLIDKDLNFFNLRSKRIITIAYLHKPKNSIADLILYFFFINFELTGIGIIWKRVVQYNCPTCTLMKLPAYEVVLCLKLPFQHLFWHPLPHLLRCRGRVFAHLLPYWLSDLLTYKEMLLIIFKHAYQVFSHHLLQTHSLLLRITLSQMYLRKFWSPMLHQQTLCSFIPSFQLL